MTNLDFFLNDKYCEFIEDYEDKWLQYATADERMNAFFGTLENAQNVYEKWKKNEDIWTEKKLLV